MISLTKKSINWRWSDRDTTFWAEVPSTSEGSLAFLLSRLAPGIAIRDVDPLGSVNAKIAQVAKV